MGFKSNNSELFTACNLFLDIAVMVECLVFKFVCCNTKKFYIFTCMAEVSSIHQFVLFARSVSCIKTNGHDMTFQKRGRTVFLCTVMEM